MNNPGNGNELELNGKEVECEHLKYVYVVAEAQKHQDIFIADSIDRQFESNRLGHVHQLLLV